MQLLVNDNENGGGNKRGVRVFGHIVEGGTWPEKFGNRWLRTLPSAKLVSAFP